MNTFHIVTVDNTWTDETTTVQDCEARGFEVAPSRRFGEFQLFHAGHMVGWLFASKAEQIAFLAARGAV